MSQPPEWMVPLTDHIAARMEAVDVLSPIACHYCEVEGAWEITLFASQTEIHGGPNDGGFRLSRFHLDLNALTEPFDEVESVYWQAHELGPEDDLGPHIGIEGVYQGHLVWLRILSLAPRQFLPGRRALVQQRAWQELW